MAKKEAGSGGAWAIVFLAVLAIAAAVIYGPYQAKQPSANGDRVVYKPIWERPEKTSLDVERLALTCLAIVAVAEALILLFRRRSTTETLQVQPAAPPTVAPVKKASTPKPPARSEAITLLAALQREARFVDFIQEPLAGYSDAQVGAVARDVHRDCAAVLDRMFALKPAVADEEGKDVSVPADFDSNRWRLTGNVTGEPPFRGRLVHPGWEATACELPTWSGSSGSARIVAPAEVELK
jgi:hypothetical protein